LILLLNLLSENTDACSTHLIDGDGNFNVAGVDHFTKEVKLTECGLSYAIVSIMGPQSSGKSTLLNHLFRTNFREMDAYRGRTQTTKGIWMACCVGIEPCSIVMDLEGSDGRERGEDDTTFEKQSALFALAVSDIVLINMWCHDIGREQAANKPLLKTVFQAMMRLFSPRKTTLMFVIRDKTRTPLENLEPILREDVQKIWDAVPKPQNHKDTPLSEFFNVEVVALSSFEEKEEQFKEQVSDLRQRFYNSIAPSGLAGDRCSVVPASGFAFSAQQIWKIIKENKDLDLPAHKVMVATVRCEEISNEKFSSFDNNEEWHELEEEVQSRVVPGFGQKLSSILGTCLSEYYAELIFYVDMIITASTDILACVLCLRLYNRNPTLGSLALAPKKLNEALSGPVEALLDEAGDDTWPAIRKLFLREAEAAVSGFSAGLSGYELDGLSREKMILRLRDHARGVVEGKAREEAGRILIRMKDRFSTLFSHDSDSMPRVWTGKEDIQAITKTARSSSLKFLSVVAAIRLDDDPDNIEKTLTLALVENRSAGAANKSTTSADPLASSAWDEVPAGKTLITPVQCKSLWRQFKAETEYTLTQAIAAQEASMRNNNWLPPPWAIAALVILGFNEFMTLLRNPLYFGLIC
ncbi:hypothetical protein Leryth_003136, partial [Lithospermum erythrorhizon]